MNRSRHRPPQRLVARTLALLLAGVALMPPLTAHAQMAPLGRAIAQGNGNTVKSCSNDARERAEGQAWQRALLQNRISTSFETCLRQQSASVVEIRFDKPKSTGPTSCELAFEARYNRPELVRASRSCVRIERTIPVGVVMRAEKNRQSDMSLALQAISLVSNKLDDANFMIIDLSPFQIDFQSLKEISQCAFTGAETVDWKEGCARQLPNYAAGRDNLIDRVARAVQEYPELAHWRDCGGLFITGEIAVEATQRDSAGRLQLDYQSLGAVVSTIAPFTNERISPADLGGEAQATGQVVTLLSELAGNDAIDKLARAARPDTCQTGAR